MKLLGFQLEVYSRNFNSLSYSQGLTKIEEKSKQLIIDFINTHILKRLEKSLGINWSLIKKNQSVIQNQTIPF